MGPIRLFVVLSLLFSTGQGRSLQARKTRQTIFFPQESDDFCLTPEQQPGKCQSLFDCDPLFRLLEDPRPRVFKYLRRSSCGFVQFEPMVCCSQYELPDYLSEPDPVLSPAPHVTTFIRPSPGLFHKPTSSSSSGNVPDPTQVQVEAQPDVPVRNVPPATPGTILSRDCGRSPVKRNRIAEGEESPKGAWPWMTLLLIGNEQTGDLSGVCGGVLVSNRHVLTAAQCVNGDNPIVIAVPGVNEYGNDEKADDQPAQRILVSGIHVHENYDSRTFQNDIALLKLSETIQFSDEISPICLPIEESFRTQNFTKKLPYVTGWGVTSDGVIGGEPHVIMRELQLQVVARSTCRQSYDDYPTAVIDETVLCTHFPDDGKEACDGDAGGPLMIAHENRFHLLGLVSNGKGCGQPHFPRIYTRVPNFVDWIVSKMQS